MRKKVRWIGITGAWLLMVACGSLFSARRVAPREDAAPREPGARIAVRTLNRLSANMVSAGERIEVELAEPVLLEGLPRVPAEVKAVLHVVDVNQGMRSAGRALMRLRLTQLRPSKARYLEIQSHPLEFRGAEANLPAGTTLAFELVSTAPEAAVRRDLR